MIVHQGPRVPYPPLGGPAWICASRVGIKGCHRRAYSGQGALGKLEPVNGDRRRHGDQGDLRKAVTRDRVKWVDFGPHLEIGRSGDGLILARMWHGGTGFWINLQNVLRPDLRQQVSPRL